MITLIKNRQWLIPYTDEDMRQLLKLNLRMTKYDVDMLPTLRLIAKQEIVVLDFYKTLLDPLFERLEKAWCVNNRSIKYQKNRLKLIAPLSPKNIRALQTIENKLLAFFERWGFDTEFIPTESATKCMLTIDYVSSRDKYPVIINNDRESDPDFNPAILEFGTFRIVLDQHQDSYGMRFEELIAGEWETVRSVSKISLRQITSSHFISTLVTMFNQQMMK